MKYLCMVFVEEGKLEALSEAELTALNRESLAYDKELIEAGRLHAAQALQPVRSARSLRMRNGKLSVTDGPFAETHEQIGGFILIEAADLEDAIQVASRMPPLRLGGVEVRPIKDISV